MNHTKVIDCFKRYHRPIRAWLRKRLITKHGEIEVEDLAQEVFMRLLRYDSRDVIDNHAGYIFRVAANVMSEWKERKRNRAQHDPKWLESLSIETDWSQHEIANYIKVFLKTLPPRRREILILHVYEELPYKDIAIKLDLSYRVVLRELTKAYTALRFRVAADELTEVNHS